MGDNFPQTPGAGRNVATDEVTYSGDTADVQIFRIVAVTGAEGSKTVSEISDAAGLAVVARRPLVKVAVTSGGLTTTATAYTAGDQVGTLFTFADCARVSGGGGTIVGATVISAADTIGTMDLVLFDSSVTLSGGDNGAFSISDADALKLVGLVQLSGAFDIGGNRIAQAVNIAMPYTCSATSLYGSLITRTGIAATPFAAATDLQVNLYVELN